MFCFFKVGFEFVLSTSQLNGMTKICYPNMCSVSIAHDWTRGYVQMRYPQLWMCRNPVNKKHRNFGKECNSPNCRARLPQISSWFLRSFLSQESSGSIDSLASPMLQTSKREFFCFRNQIYTFETIRQCHRSEI